jgi:hypothetical protein
MHGPINVKSPNNISTWQMGFNSAFKGLMTSYHLKKSRIMQYNGTLSPDRDLHTASLEHLVLLVFFYASHPVVLYNLVINFINV